MPPETNANEQECWYNIWESSTTVYLYKSLILLALPSYSELYYVLAYQVVHYVPH